jgi:predicted dehydrogenase
MSVAGPPAPLKVAVIGAGTMGMNHLRVLHDSTGPALQLVGVAERDEPTLARAVHRFHVAGFADYRQLLWETCPDLVAVVVPTNLHFEVAAYALDQGLHVLIEKPVTPTVDEALALKARATHRGQTVAVGHIERFNPAVIALKQLVMDGHLGQIFSLHARRIGPYPPRIRDVGVALDLATHDLDAMRYLIDADVERAFAETLWHVHPQQEDLLFGILRFRNGAVGMLDVNWLTPTKVRELSVTGEHGMYHINYLTQDLYFYENDYSPMHWDALRSQLGVSEGTMTRLKVHKREPLQAQYDDVVLAIREGRPPAVTLDDGVAALRLAHQLIGSTRVGEVVTCSL